MPDDDLLQGLLAANFPGLSLPAHAAARLPALVPRRRLADGRSLFVPGQRTAAFYAVAAGEIETRFTGLDGTVSVIENVGPPRFFGLAAFAAGQPAEYEAVARGADGRVRTPLRRHVAAAAGRAPPGRRRALRPRAGPAGA
jgi:CRP-like cAMP-binding protein